MPLSPLRLHPLLFHFFILYLPFLVVQVKANVISALSSLRLRLDHRPFVRSGNFLTVSSTYPVALSSGALHNITVPTRRPLGILNLLLFLSYLLPCPLLFSAIFFCLVYLLLEEGGPSPPMSVLRIYKIRYDRGCVSREIIYPRQPLTLLLSRSYPRGQISGFAQRSKSAPREKKRIGQPNINRRIFYSTRNLSARRNRSKFQRSDY